jgi:hypothetical protein
MAKVQCLSQTPRKWRCNAINPGTQNTAKRQIHALVKTALISHYKQNSDIKRSIYLRNVKVIDSMPSSGKTQWMIQHIDELDRETKVIYITPFLTETERIKKSCKGRYFQLPEAKHGQGSKLTHFKDLLRQGRNIASTHSLFSMIDQETMDLIEANNYILVLDEVMEVVASMDILTDREELSDEERKRIAKKDMEILIAKNFVSVDSQYKVKWEDEKANLSKYSTLKENIDGGNVYFSANTLLIQVFPPEIFKTDIFKEIFLMTYQFDFQIQSYYFRFFDIPYEKFGVIKHRKAKRHKYKFRFVSYDEYLEYDGAKRKELKKLINICDSKKLNLLGSPSEETGMSLSLGCYKGCDSNGFKIIQSKAKTYLKNHLDGHSSTMMWTCFKDYEDEIKNHRFIDKNFLALNARATNDYRHKSGIVYLVNRFINPYFPHLFRTKDIDFDGDAFALAEMLQFIFRSQIRDDKPIKIFIPSERMRNLLTRWLDGEF